VAIPIPSIHPAVSSSNFQTFTDVVNTLNTGGVCGSGPVTINVSPGTYTEQIVLNVIGGTSSTNTVTFQYNGSDSTQVTLTYPNATPSTITP